MARTVRTPGATEEQAAEVPTEPTTDAVETEEQASEEGGVFVESVDQLVLVEVLERLTRIEDKLDMLAEQAGLKITKPPRFKFDPAKGHVME